MRLPSDDRVVERQLGRAPRGRWRVVARCSYGAPVVIATHPLLPSGEPFPTLLWLTCPHLLERISEVESAGGTTRWAERLAAEPVLAERMRVADEAYRLARRAEAGAEDPCPDVGIAGQRDPLGTKCLHAHVAAYLSGLDDPVGEGALAGSPRECDDARCTGEVR
ncbi:MAG: DUF501 domain-containing protein [Coriobacteriia bacterium]